MEDLPARTSTVFVQDKALCGSSLLQWSLRSDIPRKLNFDCRSKDNFPPFNFHQGEEEEGNDEWVVVKKQKFTILIPPPSPPAQQIMMEMREKASVSGQPKAACSMPNAKKGRANANKNRSSFSPQAYAHGVGSMGAVSVVNLRMRAMNLERKLGGLPPLLGPADHRFMAAVLESKKFSQYQLANLTTSKLKEMGMNTEKINGMHRFMAAVLESKKFSQYQLSNLTTSKLKEMGMNTVGRRRKLIHAIDLLCRPYYYTAPGIPSSHRRRGAL